MKNIKILLAWILSIALIFTLCSCNLFGWSDSEEKPGEEEPEDEGQKLLTFKEYVELSMEEQVAYFNSFGTVEAFAAWYNVAKAEYELLYGPIDGTPDDGDDEDNNNPGSDDGPGVDVGIGDKIPEDDEGSEDNKGDEPVDPDNGEGNEPGNEGDDPADNPSDGGEGDDPKEPGNGPGNEGDDPADNPSDGGEGDDPKEPGNEPGNEGDDPADNPSDGGEGDDPDEPGEGEGKVLLTWEEYLALSLEEQSAYFDSFEGMDAFIAWYNAALDAYNEANKAPDLPEDGGIDLSGK